MKIKNIICIVICSLSIGMLKTQAQDEALRFISYNIYQGMRLDTTSEKSLFSSWVKSMNSDVLALEEVSNFTQKDLEKLAMSYGHRYAVLLKEDGFKYPVALTSKFPIIDAHKVTDNMDRGFIMAQVGSYKVLVLHLSPFTVAKRNGEADLILNTIRAYSENRKWVIMGDFNSLSPDDSLNYTNGELLDAYKKSDLRYESHNNLLNGKLDFQVVGKFLNDGFIDTSLLEKENEVLSSRPTKTNQGAVPSRIDYIFVSKDLKRKIATSKIIKDAFTDYYSDHYPVLIELK